MNHPLCPITGKPAVRHVQWISTDFLTALWRITFKTNSQPSFNGHKQLGLWESPTGLYFFDPLLEGDHEFYCQFYRRLEKANLFDDNTIRNEFRIAANHIKTGDSVLDVGCGYGSFQTVIPHATYTGLDPHFAEKNPAQNVLNQTLVEHLKEHFEFYDVVCSFQVLEHIATPATFFSQMAQAVKPGGRVIVGVPHIPSALTRIPNFLMNAPPHHLTWWTPNALKTLAENHGLNVEIIENVPWGNSDKLIYWIERCSIIRCKDIYFRHAWSWHASSFIAFILGKIINTFRGIPVTSDEGGGLIMVANKP